MTLDPTRLDQIILDMIRDANQGPKFRTEYLNDWTFAEAWTRRVPLVPDHVWSYLGQETDTGHHVYWCEDHGHRKRFTAGPVGV